MGIFDKVRDFVSPVEGDDEDYEEEVSYEEQPVADVTPKTAKYEKPTTKQLRGVTSGTSEVCLFEPRSFEEAEAIGTKLKQRSTVVVNLHRLPREYSQRTIDFLTGVVFALDGTIQKVGHNAILCAPQNVDVSGGITLSSDDN